MYSFLTLHCRNLDDAPAGTVVPELSIAKRIRVNLRGLTNVSKNDKMIRFALKKPAQRGERLLATGGTRGNECIKE